MSDLIPKLPTLIGWFMITTGIGLALLIIQFIKDHNKH